MNRCTFAILVAVCVVVLTGCGSDLAGGSTAPDSPTMPAGTAAGIAEGSGATNSATAAEPPSQTSSQPASDLSTAVGTTATTTPEPPGSSQQPMPSADGIALPGDDSTAAVAADGSPWFDTFCSAVSTAISTRADLDTINVGDAASEQSALIGMLISVAEAFRAAASVLSGAAPPDGTDSQWTSNVIAGLESSSSQSDDAGTRLAGSDPEDTAAQAAAASTVMAATDEVRHLTDALGGALPSSNAVHRAIAGAPSCVGILR